MNFIKIRLTAPEQIPASWGQLTVVSGKDRLVIQDSGQHYPIKQAGFVANDEPVAPGRSRKTTRSRLVQNPPGMKARQGIRKGKIEVRHFDSVVSGADNEISANATTWVGENLEFFN
jgi:hypothetical protein